MSSRPKVEPLAASHGRAEFLSGVDALDRYFHQQVGQDVRRKVTACFVAREIASDRVAGFYTLAAGSILLFEIPAPLAKRLPRYPSIPELDWAVSLSLAHTKAAS